MRKSNRLKLRFALEHRVFLLAWFGLVVCLPTRASSAARESSSAFRGTAALADTRRAVSLGERPSGAEAIDHLRDWIVSELKPLGGQLSLDSFTGQTPIGPVPMVNILLK